VVSWTVYSLLLRAWPSRFGPLARLTLVAIAGIGYYVLHRVGSYRLVADRGSWRWSRW
jgi:hypothetical protein